MQQLHNINERERSFLSSAIHDGLLQDIIGTHMLLQGCEELEPDALAERLERARKTLRSAISHGRRVIGELRPMILDEQGLVNAIEFYAAELETRSALKIEVVNRSNLEITSAFWGGNVFRIIQGAMNNVEEHSQSGTATVEISKENGLFCVMVRDEGVGFDTDSVRDSFGLQCIRERAEIFGGSATVRSEPGRGCTVSIRIPLPPAPRAIT